MKIGNERYVSLTTFRGSGEAVSIPVWIVELEEQRVGFTTSSSSWKVKRLASNPSVLLQASDSRGKVKPGSAQVPGTGAVVRNDEYVAVRAKVKAKYGVQFTLISFIGSLAKLFGRGSGIDCAVVVNLD